MAASVNNVLRDTSNLAEDNDVSLGDLLEQDQGGDEAANIEAKPKTEDTKPAGVSREDFEELKGNLSKLADTNRELELQLTYLRGAANREQKQETTVEPAPKQFELNLEEAAERIAVGGKAGMEALLDVVRKVVAHERDDIERNVDTKVNSRLGAQNAQTARQQAFAREIDTVAKLAGEFWGTDEFKEAADKEALTILQTRGGKSMNDFQPGDLLAAAKTVIADWKLSGKIKPKADETAPASRPLREIIRNVPRSDDTGTNRRAASGPPKTIDELYPNEKDRQFARAAAKKLNVDESTWVTNYLAASNEDEDYAR